MSAPEVVTVKEVLIEAAARVEAAERDRDRALDALRQNVRVLEAVRGYVTGYDAVPYQDALRDAYAVLADQEQAR